MQLERAIRAGQYPPGQRLPGQRQLAQELGVSRPILRESLQMLELRGLIMTHHGSGTYVAEPLAIATDPQSWLSEHRSQLQEFYEFRQIIEPEAAALAAVRATRDEVERLARNVAEAAEAVASDQIYGFVILDIEFHSLVAEMSHNPYLFHALNQLVNLDTDVRQVIHRLPGHLAVAYGRHVAIFEAIADHDAVRARASMRSALVDVLHEIGGART